MQLRVIQGSRGGGRSPPWLNALAAASVLFAVVSCALMLRNVFPGTAGVAVAAVEAPVGEAVQALIPPVLKLTEPFPNCRAAHAAGIYDIPRGSPAYLERQDGDGDGLACEPPRGMY